MSPSTAAPVKTKTNTLIGRTDSCGIHSFKGVPFAQPPVGSLRWKPAQPLPVSDAALDAGSFRKAPMQIPFVPEMAPEEGFGEDCLYLSSSMVYSRGNR